jgi:peptidoglycan LD-endopeptidase LytH
MTTAQQHRQLVQLLEKYQPSFKPVVPFNPGNDKLTALDFTAANTALTADIIEEIDRFCSYINGKLETAGALYGIGGYAEHRTVYQASRLFDAPSPGDEPRRLHLGTDIWGRAGTPVTAPLEGRIYSLAHNHQAGDYGATIIMMHELEGFIFYSLYGHLSLNSLNNNELGALVPAGTLIAHLGPPAENGHWPPHLHFQLIIDLQGQTGDYPGVCAFSKKEAFLCNCPDPETVLRLNRFIN